MKGGFYRSTFENAPRIDPIRLYEKYIGIERRELMATHWRAFHKKAKRRSIVRCEDCGSRDAMECGVYGYEKPRYFYCSTCAEKFGFCAACRIYCLGIESFEFGRYRGYCENCQDQLRAEDYDDYDPEY